MTPGENGGVGCDGSLRQASSASTSHVCDRRLLDPRGLLLVLIGCALAGLTSCHLLFGVPEPSAEDERCDDSTSCLPGTHCNPNSSRCEARIEQAGACGDAIGDDACLTGYCVDGYCCDTACDQACGSCALVSQEGTCSPYPAGDDPEQECQFDLQQCRLAACNGRYGDNACDAPEDTVCVAGTCQDDVGAVAPLRCDAGGVCARSVTAAPTLCGVYSCDIEACHTGCSSNEQCAPDNACVLSSKRCQPQVSTGADHSCALVDGKVYCWGHDNAGQLGSKIAACQVQDDSRHEATPTEVTDLLGLQVSAISSGLDHSCAIVDGGEVRCWGSNAFGELGNTAEPNSLCTGPVQVGTLDGIVEISCGGRHCCALRNVGSGGTVYCWGANAYGQLGDDSTAPGPVQVMGVGNAMGISSGGEHTCALILDASQKVVARCWGNGERGQLGSGVFAGSLTPVPVLTPVEMTGVGFKMISAGGQHTCALSDNGIGYCWGANDYGQLGDGTLLDRAVPVELLNAPIIDEMLSVSAGLNHTCGILQAPARPVVCWGNNSTGQLGVGDVYGFAPAALILNEFWNTGAVSSGSQHTCAYKVRDTLAGSSGALFCWGAGGWGELGDGNPAGASLLPSQVADL